MALLQGLAILAAVAVVFGVVLASGRPEPEARALGFATLLFANIALLLIDRSRSGPIRKAFQRPNPALWWIICGAAAFLAFVLSIPALRGLFLFAPLHADELAICLAAGAVSVLWFEIPKRLRSGRRRKSPPAPNEKP